MDVTDVRCEDMGLDLSESSGGNLRTDYLSIYQLLTDSPLSLQLLCVPYTMLQRPSVSTELL
jgi:hypothetical protein